MGSLLSRPLLRLQGEGAPGKTNSSNTREQPQKKRGLAPLRNEEAPEGSRVTIIYNLPLSDYSAYRQGDRFVVVIPKADAPRVRSNLRGRGFDGVQVERRGDDAVLSFRMQPGVRARVDQQFNKLEVLFSAPEGAATNATTGQTTSASSAATAGRSAQTTAAPSPAPPINNSAASAARANQANANEGRTASSAGAAASTESNATAAPEATTLSQPSPTETSSASRSRPHTDGAVAAQQQQQQPSPVGETAGAPSTDLRTVLRRNWLPISIAILLLASAYGIIAARRRTGRDSDSSSDISSDSSSDISSNRTPEEHAAATEALDQGAAAERLEIAEELAGHEAEQEEEEPAPAEMVEDGPLIESGEAALAQSNPREEVASETEQAAAIEESSPADEDPSRIRSTVLRFLGSELASERAAAVMDMARLGGDDALRQIGAAFDDPAQQVRDAAARALFNVSADRASSFKRIMRDSSRERRRRIGAAIASSGMAQEALHDLTSESGERAYDALLVLSLMAKAGEVQSLITAIEEHPSTEVRLAIVKLLALSGQQDVLSTFHYLATRDSLPIVVRSSIMEAIFQINNPRPLDQQPLDQPAA
jgi:hypothetical protein